MAYRARIQLAVLDHNAHIGRNPKCYTDSQEFQYHRRYRKQTKNWDAVKVMESKEYKQITDLSNEVYKYWEESEFNMKKRSVIPGNHPCNIQHTIAHTQPPETNVIVVNTKSRFT